MQVYDLGVSRRGSGSPVGPVAGLWSMNDLLVVSRGMGGDLFLKTYLLSYPFTKSFWKLGGLHFNSPTVYPERRPLEQDPVWKPGNAEFQLGAEVG